MKQILVSEELLLKIEESLESRCGTNAPERREILPQLRELLEQPAEQEPVANIFERMHADGHVWITTIAAAKLCIANAAPQAQQPARIGSGVTVEQTLEQWEHDFSNPMTPEQQVDWVKRERDFAARQAQQPAKEKS